MKAKTNLYRNMNKCGSHIHFSWNENIIIMNLQQSTPFLFYLSLVLQIFLLLIILLYFSSYVVVSRFRRRDRDDLYSNDEDEVLVYRIR